MGIQYRQLESKLFRIVCFPSEQKPKLTLFHFSSLGEHDLERHELGFVGGGVEANQEQPLRPRRSSSAGGHQEAGLKNEQILILLIYLYITDGSLDKNHSEQSKRRYHVKVTINIYCFNYVFDPL